MLSGLRATVEAGPRAVQKVAGEVKDLFFREDLSAEEREVLLAQARRAAREREGQPVLPENRQRCAHLTNTAEELSAAIRDPSVDRLEGDIWKEGAVDLPGLRGEPAMGHHLQDGDGLRFRDWLEIAGASGKALKLDLKQTSVVSDVARAVEAAGIPDERLTFNAGVVTDNGSGPIRWARDAYDRVLGQNFSAKDLKPLRERFPDAQLSIDIHVRSGEREYSEAQLEELVRTAREVGGPIVFVLRADLATPQVIDRLRGGGKVAIWNDPEKQPLVRTQAEADALSEHFRQLGVNGPIDLRPR